MNRFYITTDPSDNLLFNIWDNRTGVLIAYTRNKSLANRIANLSNKNDRATLPID